MKNFLPDPNSHFRPKKYMTYQGLWCALIVSIVFMFGIHPAFTFVMIGSIIGLQFFTNAKALEKEESQLLESLHTIADYNIEVAEYNSYHPNGNKKPMEIYSLLEFNFGKNWISSLEEHQISWIQKNYDSIIEKKMSHELQLETQQEHLKNIGNNEQKQLEAYYRGKKEISSDNDFDWNSLNS